MSTQQKTIVRRAFDEVYNQGNLDAVDELVTEDFVARSPSEEIRGPEGMKQYVSALRAAFPDLHITVDDQFEDGDTVVTRWTARGTHLGPFLGIAPTGKQGSMTGIDIDRIVNGKTVECWTQSDALGLLQQLGAIPSPEAPVS